MSFYPYGQPNYGNYGYQPTYQPTMPQPVQPQQQQVQQQQTQPTTNKIYVTSLEDALARFASPNSITVYHLQDESGEIEIATDGFGKKNYKVHKLTEFTPVESGKEQKTQYATSEYASGLEQRLQGAESRIKALEARLSKQSKTIKTEVTDNE